MDITKVSITQIAALIAALGTIIGAGFTIDSHYAKRSDIDSLRKEINISVDLLHKQILENEELKQQLGNNETALRVIAERNRQELADIRARLEKERFMYRIISPMRSEAPVPAAAAAPPANQEIPSPNSEGDL